VTAQSEAGRGSSGRRSKRLELDERIERRLAWLMFGRLVLSLMSFGIAIGLDGFGPELSEAARRGLYWSVAFAFLATALSGIWFGRIRNAQRFALFQIAVDVAIVTSLVHFSGGRESVFVFLYALVTVYGSLLFERRGALVAACFSAVAYALALVASSRGWLLGVEGPGHPADFAQLAGVWVVQVGALFLVGGLASVLAVEAYRTGKALDQRTSDLRELLDLHRHTVESLMSGLLTTGLDGRLTSFNPEAERILGFSAEDVIGRHIDEIIPGAHDLVVEPAGSVPTVRNMRSRLAHRNVSGQEVFLGLAGSVLKDVEGSPAGYIVIFQDVTAVVAMEDELRRSERLAAVGEMSAKIAHEIRNPLAAISGSIQILQSGIQQGPAEGEHARLMGIVVRETDRLNALIGDFLQYSRPGPLLPKPVELSVLVDEVVKVFEVSLPEGTRVLTDGLKPVIASADPDQLRQVLWNLCINAVEAMPEGGVLRLSTGVVPDPSSQGGGESRRNDAGYRELGRLVAHQWAEIALEDTGTGIPAEVKEHIFEPFFTTKESGSGLGLATVHRIVENHGGVLEVSSAAGKGTRVQIRLPLSEVPE